MAAHQSVLQAQVVAETESKADIARSLRESQLEWERAQQSGALEDVRALRSELESYHSRESVLQSQCAELEVQNSALKSEVEGLSLKLNAEVKGLSEKLEEEQKQYQSLKQERDHAAEELSSIQGLIEHETQSLKFQLSTQAIELKETKKVGGATGT